MSDVFSRPVDLLQHLIAIPSVNPAYDAESTGELLVARFIERWADDLGLCVERQIVLDGRYNLICRLVIDENLPTLLFESHMDTVGIVSGTRADFVPKIEGGLLYGRGACDTKGSMAAMMAAVERLVSQRNQLACNVQLLAAVDEETIGSGSLLYARRSPNVVAAIVGEPTGTRIVNAHKGVFRDRITVVGKAAHTSVVSEGINAIDGMADVIVALREVSHRLTAAGGGGTLTVSLIEGGAGINIVPERCAIRFDRRTVPGDSAASVIADIEEALDSVRLRRPELTIHREATPELDVSPLNTSPDAPIVRAAASAARTLGLDPAPISVPYGSDASYLNDEAGIPCIVFGPGSIDVAHSADEHVPLTEVVDAANFLVAIALAFGQTGTSP